MVWYRNVAEAQLEAFLTDRHGVRRAVSLPPSHVRTDQIDDMRQFAADHLAPPIADIVMSVSEPFVQAVYDVEGPGMVSGRELDELDELAEVLKHTDVDTFDFDAWDEVHQRCHMLLLAYSGSKMLGSAGESGRCRAPPGRRPGRPRLSQENDHRAHP